VDRSGTSYQRGGPLGVAFQHQEKGLKLWHSNDSW